MSFAFNYINYIFSEFIRIMTITFFSLTLTSARTPGCFWGQPTKTSTTTVPTAIERGPATGVSDPPPPAHNMHHLMGDMRSRHTAPRRRSRRARQSDSSIGRLGGPEALINRYRRIL